VFADPDAFLAFLWTILGGVTVGSFLNVCIYRLPRGESIVTPRSHCPACERTLRWNDLIPVCSYLWLRGRCRYCGAPVSIQYPLVELANLGLWLLALAFFDGLTSLVLLQLFLSALFTLSLIDYHAMIIPDQINLTITILAIIAAILLPLPALSERLLGLLLGSGSLLLISLLSLKFWQRQGIGTGDIKMMAACGLYLGWQLTAVALCLSPYLALLGVLIRRVAGKALARDHLVPFGPALALACLLAAFWGEEILIIYWNFIGR